MKTIVFTIFCVLCSLALKPAFKNTAQDFISVNHKTYIRYQKKIFDYTKLVIEAKITKMIENPKQIRMDEVKISLKSSVSDGWKMIDSKPSVRGGIYKWTLNSIVPCHSHNINITVYSVKNESSSTWMYPNTIPAASQDMLIQSPYIPNKPNKVTITENYNGTVFEWTDVPCINSYTVQISNTLNMFESEVLEVVQETSLSYKLQTCQEYVVYISANIAEQYSEDAEMTFTTNPEEKDSERLNPKLFVEKDNVVVQWKASEKLGCIEHYKVQICTTYGNCSSHTKLKKDERNRFMEIKYMNLEICTQYSIIITPVHKQKYIQPKILSFKTLPDPDIEMKNNGPMSALEPKSKYLE